MDRTSRPRSEPEPDGGLTGPDAVRAMLLLMPRVAARVKRIAVPEALAGFQLAPRHLSLLSYLVYDGPMPVGTLAARLEVAHTTASLMVGDLTRQGVLERRPDPADRRRTIVSLTADPATRTAIETWLANGAAAWHAAFAPLTPAERALFVRTMAAYEQGAAAES
ncbi:MarR family winged helix-turn-helix transcriptional regulator [Kitasatospora cheerisanensis]|uniref:MarR family transcriptional regulator n=1 Tax=Kitasatospora cheerisanensis KCTC 2395 TaxID=1348663 RepID=A0A066YMI1_9ACTN|nr:MarR family winged helix-turn-helix transcriptional regulator [Kitasatospora cheerisanensis]KDN81149.1 MarR family transcriptional regulator [Kitasatospora cheerisanensis KCTC 2395]